MLAREPAIIHAGAGREVDLRADLQALAPLAGERLPEHLLGPGVGVDVGGVEGRDARVKGGMDGGPGRLVIDLRPVRDPVAVGDLADEQAASAEVSVLHPRRLGGTHRRLRFGADASDL